MNQEKTTLSVMDRIDRFGLVPVIKLEDAAQAVPLADALCRGGLPVAEVTFRTAAAAESIRRIRAAHPEMPAAPSVRPSAVGSRCTSGKP